MQTEPNSFEPLICINRINETADSATFEFKKLDEGLFDYKAGQFLTFEVDVAGELEYRAYSLSSTPSQPKSATVTIKRVEHGKVSNYLLDHLQTGFAIPAMAPAGEFTIEDNQVTPDIVLISAGCGITPCISIARWLLDTQQQVQIHFIHTARSEMDVIMAEQLDLLNTRHDNFQLTRIIKHTNNKRDIPGKLNAEMFADLIPNITGKTFFVCGPEGYMDMVESLASEAGADMALFHKESFSPTTAESDTQESTVHYQAISPQYAKNFVIGENQTLLDALENEGLPIIAACRSGMCGSCKCKVTGKTESTSQATLTDKEIEQGYVLACSSKVKSDVVIEI